MVLQIRIFPIGTLAAEKGDHWAMDAIEYDETLVDDLGANYTCTRSEVPAGRNANEFTIRNLSQADADTKKANILASKFVGHKGLVWEGDVIDTSPVFAPTDISDLISWNKGDDATTITEFEGDVSQWDDKGPAGINPVQGSIISQPNTNVNTINGKNVVEFLVSNSMLASGFSEPFAVGDSLDLFLVSKPSTLNESQLLYLSPWTNYFLKTTMSRMSGQADLTFASSLAARLFEVRFTDTSHAVTIDGVLKGSQTFASVGAWAYTLIQLASLENIAEYTIGRNMTTQEKDDMRAYLKAEWGTA